MFGSVLNRATEASVCWSKGFFQFLRMCHHLIPVMSMIVSQMPQKLLLPGELSVAFKALPGQEGQERLVVQYVLTSGCGDRLEHQAVQFGLRPMFNCASLRSQVVLLEVLSQAVLCGVRLATEVTSQIDGWLCVAVLLNQVLVCEQQRQLP